MLHRRVHEDTRGYTAYFYDPHHFDEDYCVIGYNAVYASNRLLINLSAICLLFFLTFGIPAAFAYSYDTLYQYVKKNPNAQYFLWAVIMVIIAR